MIKRGLCSAAVAVAITLSAAGQETVVIPNVNESTPGPSNQAFPFNSGNMRYQQVFAADQFGDLRGIVQSFAYRVDESSGDPFSSAPIQTQIWFAHTQVAPRGMSLTFDDNMGNDKTLVFDGPLTLSSDGSGAFDIVVDVEDVFVYNGVDNFIMEIIVRGGASTTQFDAAGTGLGRGDTDWTDRLWATNPDAQTGSSNGDDGMVTEFTLTGGDSCIYTLKKSKAKGGCGACPAKGDDYRTFTECENKKDCEKKIATTVACPDGGNGTCKLKGKRNACG